MSTKKTSKKTAKKVETPKVEEPKVEEVVVEEEHHNEVLEEPVIIDEPKPEDDIPVIEPEKEPKVKKSDVIGSLKGGKEVHQAGHLRVQAVRKVVPMRALPKELQRWLINKGYGTNVYLKPKEWLEKHNVDQEKIKELKDFINANYL